MENLIYIIIGLSFILLVLFTILIILLLKNKSSLSDINLKEKVCPTCGQILEPTWVRCPFCADDIKNSEKKLETIPSIQPIGYLLIKTGPNRGDIYKISKTKITIGSGNYNDIVIHDNSVSPQHCIIEFKDNKFFVVDQNSYLGTKLNNRTIKISELSDNDEITIGTNIFVFRILE